MKSPATPGSSTVNRRQPLLRTSTPPPLTPTMKANKRKSEVAGRTAAECATVCCCIPCAVAHFLVLAVYKVPTGLCRKMLRKNKQKRLLNKKNESKSGYAGAAVKKSENSDVAAGRSGGGGKTVSPESEMEMWGRFYEEGFWRNSSEKKED